MKTTALVSLLLLCASVRGDLIEVTATGVVDSVDVGRNMPLRTTVRPGTNVRMVYAYQEAIEDQGQFRPNMATYPLAEAVQWTAGDYSHASEGKISVFANNFDINTNSEMLPGESVVYGGREVSVEGYIRLHLSPVIHDPVVLSLEPPVLREDIDSRRVDVTIANPISQPLRDGLSSVLSTITSITSNRFVAGDANRSGNVSQLDVVAVLAANMYLTGEPALWGEGDWTGDGLFNQLDIIAALPNYRVAASAVVVPEPASIVLLVFGVLLGWKHGGKGRR